MKTIFLSLFLAFGLVTVKAIEPNNTDKITAAYIGLKDALAGSNVGLAQSRAKELLNALDAQPVTGMTALQRKLFSNYLEKLKFDSRHISETTEIAHQREHFASLSKNMYAVLTGLNMNTTTLYQQYCPMKKAYWLSQSADIRNPYYGENMLKCGKITATLMPTGK